MRAFLAVPLPAAVRDACAALQSRWYTAGVRARWTPPENLHITLHFLGEIAHGATAQLAPMLAPAVVRVATAHIAIRGTGAFPDGPQPRVLWAAIEDPAGCLASLHEAAAHVLAQQNFRVEARPYTPHITLARLVPGAGAGPVAGQLAHTEEALLGSTDVTEVVLYESRLKPQGAEHRPLYRFPLATAAHGTD